MKYTGIHAISPGSIHPLERLFVNQLTVLDFSYLHAERGLLGESWLASVELGGGLDAQGMVLDFGQVKKQVKQLIDLEFDHRLLIPADHPGLALRGSGHRHRLSFTTRRGEIIEHAAPNDAVQLIDSDQITPAVVAKIIARRLRTQLPRNVTSVRIDLRPEDIPGACYQYSHGLKQHAGNCQRIAHGHRSAIHIERNGRRDPVLEKQWAEHWRDIYIGTREDLRSREDADCHHFAYTSEQGDFSLTLPSSRSVLIDTDTTVENLARHIATSLHADHPDEHFEIRAFEGVRKGALATAG